MPLPDTHPDHLRIAFGGPVRPAVAARRGTVAGVAVEAAVLSASHQIRTADGAVLETLACDAGRIGSPEGDPRRQRQARVRTPAGTWELAFSYEVRRVGAAALAALVDRLPPGALVHRFPGPADAVTAIALADGGWTTWHAYPEHGLLATSSTTAHHTPTAVPTAVPAGAAR